MKVGLCSVPPAGHSTSLLCLLNSSSMISLFKNVVEQFTRLYRRKVMLRRTRICVRNDSRESEMTLHYKLSKYLKIIASHVFFKSHCSTLYIQT